jgi:fibrillarin-like rRNA methylase
LKVLADLERDNPKFALPAARLVGLYRRLWESCVSKYIDVQKIDQSNEMLKEAGAYLKKRGTVFSFTTRSS